MPVGAHCQPKAAAMTDQSHQTPDDTKRYTSHFRGANYGGLNLGVNLGTIQPIIVEGKIGK